MNGIERLRELGRDQEEQSWSSVGKIRGRMMLQIADQIEREHVTEMRALRLPRYYVQHVLDDMERHVSCHEGAEGSPVARWASELRYAIKCDTSDDAGQQNPSCADPADVADVTSEAEEVTRDHSDDVSMSAYDLLPADEREAIAWVRDHGGIGHVRDQWSYLKGRANHADHVDLKLAKRQRQIDESHEALRRRNRRIGFLVSELNRAHNENHEEFMRRAGDYTAFADEVCKRLAPELRYVEGCSKDVMDAALNALDRRLMPEGMEWPRFEDGEPVDLYIEYDEHGGLGHGYVLIEIAYCPMCGRKLAERGQ